MVTKAATAQLEYLNCSASEKLGEYYKGTEGWIGADNIGSNLSTVRLGFVNNIKGLKNGLRGLTLNSSGLGVPYSTTFPTMKSYISTLMTQWLARNTSVSASILAPICRTTAYTVPHPTDNTLTVSFPMMGTICSALTKEIASFVQNAEYLDFLQGNYTTVLGNVSAINTTLTGLSTSYDGYKTEFEKYDRDGIKVPYLAEYGKFVVLSYVVSGLSIIVGVGCIVGMGLVLGKQNAMVVARITLVTNVLLFCLILLASITCIYYLLEAIVFKYLATLYEYLPTSP